MKKHVFLAVAILASVLGASAQLIDVKWSSTSIVGGMIRTYTAVGNKYNYRILGKKGFAIQKLDKSFNLISEQPFPEMEYGGRKLGINNPFNVFDIVCIEDNIYVLFQTLNKDNLQFEILLSRVGEGLILEQPKPIFSNSVASSVNRYLLSNNGQFLLHFFETNESTYISVYDKNMNKVWSVKYKLPFINTSTLTLSNDGTYAIGNVANELILISKTNHTSAKIQVNGDIHVNNVMYKVNNGKVICAGSYTKNGKEAGVYMATYDIAKNIMSTSAYFPYSQATVAKFDNTDKKMENVTYKLSGMICHSNGTTTLISQRNFTNRRCTENTYGNPCVDINIAGEKIITSIASNIDLNYEVLINNRIELVNPYSKLIDICIMDGGKTKLLYPTGSTSKFIYNEASISSDGQVNTNKFEFDEPIDLSRWTFEARDVPEDRILIEGQTGPSATRKYGIINLE